MLCSNYKHASAALCRLSTITGHKLCTHPHNTGSSRALSHATRSKHRNFSLRAYFNVAATMKRHKSRSRARRRRKTQANKNIFQARELLNAGAIKRIQQTLSSSPGCLVKSCGKESLFLFKGDPVD